MKAKKIEKPVELMVETKAVKKNDNANSKRCNVKKKKKTK
jgi:hypothetical protein